jgi:3-oxoadipate enol-lactonase
MEFINRYRNKIFYEILNETSNKEVLVFLNGVMASTSSWINQHKLFEKEGYKIILHDFLGQLKSDKFEGLYSFEEHALDLDELLVSLEETNIHLIGTSYGGEVAMKYAIMYPDKVKSLTIIDSVSELDNHIVKNVLEWIELAKTYNGELFFNGMMPSIYGKTYIENNSKFMKERAKSMNHIPKDYFDGQIGLYKTFLEDVTMTQELHKISCPSLIVCGEEDTLKPVKFSKIINNLIPSSRLVIIPDCGHVTIFEKPKELNSIILEFLNEIT